MFIIVFLVKNNKMRVDKLYFFIWGIYLFS